MDDRNLISRIRQDDSAAFDSLFRSWYPRLVRYAETMLHERALAEEVGQEVMLAIWNGRSRLNITESVGGYLFRATRNRVLNELRHRKIHDQALPHLGAPADAPAEAEDRLEDERIQNALRAAIAELPERCREVFELSRVQGLRYAEIAEAMDISVKTVETQMGKALKLLRERMSDWLSR
jgi:RNA polymerase sigma-70 factor (ECF subfamily)